jgi:5'-3' exoribonuclease 2
MGVPGLYRWLVERYPKTIVDAAETMPEFIGNTRVDPDTSQPNPNGVEYDNLYLDMNGIIHPACHPEDLPAPSTEEEM